MADKDPSWRHTAIYTRVEVEQLISDRRIPEDRRVFYGLKGLAGLRHGEAASLRWRQYDAALEPLGRLALEHTKTGVARGVPVHPTLARLLAEWTLSGWERLYGRRPDGADAQWDGALRPRSAQGAQIGPRCPRTAATTGHDLRRTFISLAQVDSARLDLLETVTHGPRGDIISVYTTFPWPSLCDEVRKLKIELRKASSSNFRRLRPTLLVTQPLQAPNGRAVAGVFL